MVRAGTVPLPDRIGSLRAREFSRLERTGLAYLDYTGAALYPESSIRRHAERLAATVFGNPHSENAPSRGSTSVIERAREQVLSFVHADPGEYDVVFTANATAAVHHVAASFPFGARSRLVLTADNHNSVNGTRAYAERRNARVTYVPLDAELRSFPPERWLDAVDAPSLFGFPAQSNFSGVRHPLDWIDVARRRGYLVLLDAAAYVGTSTLRLDEVRPDFVCLSCYKIFGYPTSVGVLIAQRAALDTLERPWFAGGAVDFVSVQNRIHQLQAGPQRFEDGTPDFIGIAAVADGFDFMQSIGMPRISAHVSALTARLLAGIAHINDAAGHERVVVYGPRDLAGRGATVAFNLARCDGTVVPYEMIEAAANARGIAIRGGCFCNPGAAEHAFGIPSQRALECMQERPFSLPRMRSCLDGTTVGAVRASIGLANDTRDIDRLLDLLRTF